MGGRPQNTPNLTAHFRAIIQESLAFEINSKYDETTPSVGYQDGHIWKVSIRQIIPVVWSWYSTFTESLDLWRNSGLIFWLSIKFRPKIPVVFRDFSITDVPTLDWQSRLTILERETPTRVGGKTYGSLEGPSRGRYQSLTSRCESGGSSESTTWTDGLILYLAALVLLGCRTRTSNGPETERPGEVPPPLRKLDVSGTGETRTSGNSSEKVVDREGWYRQWTRDFFWTYYKGLPLLDPLFLSTIDKDTISVFAPNFLTTLRGS